MSEFSRKYYDPNHPSFSPTPTPTPSAQTVTAEWQWQHDAHLVDLTGMQTLLRDVTFWNITDDQKRLIELAPALAASLAAADARGKRLEEALREMLGIVKSAYYPEPTGTEENAWNAALEHIEEGFAALSQTEEGR